MLQSGKIFKFTQHDSLLLVCIRFLATWLLAGTILGVVQGPWIGGSLGLIIAICWVRAVHWNVVIAALQPGSSQRSSRRVQRQASKVPGPP
jgi:hypothetical protein